MSVAEDRGGSGMERASLMQKRCLAGGGVAGGIRGIQYGVRTSEMFMNKIENDAAVRARIEALKLEHRDLDDAIHRLSEDACVDQLRLRRMKKRKLYLKDLMIFLGNRLVPDIDA